MSEAIEPFCIRVADEVLTDLRARLARTRWPSQIDAAGWSYGTERAYIAELCEYWRERYDWRAQETALNRFDQFTTPIDGLNVHFIHQRSRHTNALPLLITHGWPGSVYEFHKILGPLSDPEAHGGSAADAFHVVCPSLPGYGFSDPPRTPGFDVRSAAELEAKLMARLGYTRYGAQGGDWGAFVTRWLGLLDAEHCCGIHLNMLVALPPLGEDASAELSASEREALAQAQHFQNEETGYQAIQGTKPQTLAYGLNDSPAGLAAWIVEKFRTWSDCDGDVERRFTKDELLTNVMIYWVTQSIGPSMRLYCENRRSGRYGLAEGRLEVPTGVAVFPKEIYRAPRSWAERLYAIRRWTEMPSGGHFAALEEPDRFVEDLRAFFRELR
jgi:microsomal epoxide hydrolase